MELERNLVFGILSKAFRGGNEACPVIQVSGLGSQSSLRTEESQAPAVYS